MPIPTREKKPVIWTVSKKHDAMSADRCADGPVVTSAWRSIASPSHDMRRSNSEALKAAESKALCSGLAA